MRLKFYQWVCRQVWHQTKQCWQQFGGNFKCNKIMRIVIYQEMLASVVPDEPNKRETSRNVLTHFRIHF